MVNVVEVVNPIQLPQADQLELVRLPRYASLDTVDWCRISKVDHTSILFQ